LKREIWNSIALFGGVIALAVGGPWLVGQLRSLPHPRTLAARSDQRIVTLEVGGMTCGGCAATVQSRLAKVAGVSTVEVRYPQRRAYVVCDPAVADTALTAAVQRAGPGFLGTVVKR
jgi:copper chaperone CopZ